MNPAEVVHACPPGAASVTPCCGKTPFDLPSRHRITNDAALVTCNRLAHLVLVAGGVLSGVSLDWEDANRKAATVGGVIVTVPITADYRPPRTTAGGGG